VVRYRYCVLFSDVRAGERGQENGVRYRCFVLFSDARGCAWCFSSPTSATARPTHFSEPYGRLLGMALRIFSISSCGCDWLGACPCTDKITVPDPVPDPRQPGVHTRFLNRRKALMSGQIANVYNIPDIKNP